MSASLFIQSTALPDTLVEIACREIAFEFQRQMARYNVQVDSRAEYAFGSRVKQILESYDQGRIREAEVWKKMATDAIDRFPGAPVILPASVSKDSL